MPDSTTCSRFCAPATMSHQTHVTWNLAKHGKNTNIKRTQRLSISQPLEAYCPTTKHNPIVTPIQASTKSRPSVATPFSDVAVAVPDPVALAVAVAVAVVLAPTPVSVLEGNPDLAPVVLLVPTSAPVVAEGPALELSDVAPELEAAAVVAAVVTVVEAVLLSMPTMDRTQLAASSVNFWK